MAKVLDIGGRRFGKQVEALYEEAEGLGEIIKRWPDSYKAVFYSRMRWERDGRRLPEEIKERLCRCYGFTKGVIALADQLTPEATAGIMAEMSLSKDLQQTALTQLLMKGK